MVEIFVSIITRRAHLRSPAEPDEASGRVDG